MTSGRPQVPCHGVRMVSPVPASAPHGRQHPSDHCKHAMGTPFISQMIHLIDPMESIGWLMDISRLLLTRIFLIIGRGGFVRLASLGLGLILWYVELCVSITLTSVILPPTPGPYTMTWASELRYAAVFAAFAAPLMLWGTPWVLRRARAWWRARKHTSQA
jgi:hypothetical protein